MFILGGRRQTRLLLLFITSFLFIAFISLYFNRDLLEDAFTLIRPTWFYITGLSRYNFRPTPHEQACLDGIVTRINAPGIPNTIPKVVHFILGIDKPDPITIMFWLAVRAASANLGPDTEIRFHYVHLNEEGPWWPYIRDRVTLVRHEPDFLNEFLDIVPPPPKWHAAHKADILRLQILRNEGGIYLDTDVILLRPLETLLSGRRDVYMGYEGGNRQGLCNAVILAKKRAPFLERWYQMYKHFDPNNWNYHSVLLPAKLAQKHPDDICQLSPAAFFWPLWTEDQVALMHKPLNRSEGADISAIIEKTGGALYPEQLAYHATGYRKYMNSLTLENIMANDTRFNLLVRRYITMV